MKKGKSVGPEPGPADPLTPEARLAAGVRLLEVVSASLHLDPFAQKLQLADAASLVGSRSRDEGDGRDLFRADARVLDPTRPALVVCYRGAADAAEVARALAEVYPIEHAVSVIGFGAKSAAPTVWSGPIERLADGLGQAIAGVYLPPLDRLADRASFDTLREIVARLRAPDGCPWDREQTHQSMKKHFIEETYEAIAALDEDDWGKFAEELGDVLLQVVMHGQLGREAGTFDLEEVLRAVNEKLIRRHPHVFGEVRVGSSAEVLRNWEKIKRAESGVTRSSFASIPQSIPALMRADAVQSRAARYGWQPPAHLPDVRRLEGASPDEVRRSLGQALFELVALARRVDLDPEEALREATNRFAARLEEVIESLRRADPDFDAEPPEQRARRVNQALARRGD